MRIQLLVLSFSLFIISCKKDSGSSANKLPKLSTTVISQLGSTSVKTGGTISTAGLGIVTARGVCWGTTKGPTSAGNHTTDGTGVGTFESNITGLLPSTTYYLRAYATNAEGTAYGSEINFITLTPDVYVAGYDNAGTTAIGAVIWKNGVQTRLTNGSFEAQAYAVYVSGNDVYAAGYEKDVNGALPKVWKNGTATILSTVAESYAYNVAVSGTDVYVAGEVNGPPALTATVWKNGTAVTIGAGTDGSFATGLFIDGTDLYVTGSMFTGPGVYFPAIWKNGTVSYPASVRGVVTSVYVYNGDVYATGYELNGYTRYGKIWKNGVATSLGNGTNSSSGNQVVVYNGDVYVAFTETVNSVNVAKYSKNGTVTALTDGTKGAGSAGIAIAGNDVYVVGYENNGLRNVPKLWKNGVPSNLTDGNSFAGANGIFVK